MSAVPISDVPSFVLLLSRSAEVYENELDGSKSDRLQNQIKKFIRCVSPESALEDEDKFTRPLRQLKDRGGNVRALGTWCDCDGAELFVVQVVYDKRDEDRVLPRQDEFASRGGDLKSEFEPMGADSIRQKTTEWRQDDDLLVFGPEDFR
jgi:hypothetical protein